MAFLALGISTAFICLVCILACIARKFAKKLAREGLVQELFLEAIAAAELCASCFELIIGIIKYTKSYKIEMFMLKTFI